MLRFTLIFMLMLAFAQCSKRRHIIYWNSRMTPDLLSKNSDYVLHVKMGNFIDILCPQTSLMGITNGPDTPQDFNLYNVTKPNFDICSSGGEDNFIFACDRPEQENKLTIKFQRISPSPLGFRFQYCQDYYFVAVPRKPRHPGCHDDTSTRLRISVACKHPRRTTAATTTTTVSTTTKVVTTTEPEIDSDKDIVVPDLVSPQATNSEPDKTLDVEGNLQPQTKNKDDGGNSSSRLTPTKSVYLIVSFFALIFISFLTTSDMVCGNT